MITPEQREQFLCAIRGNASVKAAAAAAGVHRPRIYDLMKRNADFAREVQDARDEAAGGEQPTVVQHDRAAGTGRIRPRDIPIEARDLLRRALAIVEESRRPKPPSAEKVALEDWLRGKPWPDAELDADALGRLSKRALEDWRRHRLVVEAERFANGTDSAAE